MTSPRPIVERSVDRLAWPDRSIREAAMAAPPTIAAHRRLAASIEALNAIEVRKAPVPAAPSETFAIAAWNLERCLFPRR